MIYMLVITLFVKTGGQMAEIAGTFETLEGCNAHVAWIESVISQAGGSPLGIPGSTVDTRLCVEQGVAMTLLNQYNK